MTTVLQTIEDYELFLYTLQDQFTSIKRSSIALIRKGASLARVSGEIFFAREFRIVIRERILYHCTPIVVDWYGYEIWKGDQKICRYDCQPHPDDPELKISYPHHKHILPNLNRNRIPASHMSFNRANIPEIIQEVEEIIKNEKD
jgi:hypothetical protein